LSAACRTKGTSSQSSNSEAEVYSNLKLHKQTWLLH